MDNKKGGKKMKSTNYSEKVLEHFRQPRNVGTLKGPDVAMGRVGNPVCGDLMDIYIQVKDNVIIDVKFQTFGCGSAVATSSMITEMVKGQTLEQAQKVTKKDVAEELDGLPPIKMHCSNLAADALKEAIKNYRNGERVGEEGVEPPDIVTKGCSSVDIMADLPPPIKNLETYAKTGVYKKVSDFSEFDGLRTLIIETGDESLKCALELTSHTGRVILLTKYKTLTTNDADLKKKLLRSDVKILYQSHVLEISGEGEVEKIKIHDLDEDDEYELFIDALIV